MPLFGKIFEKTILITLNETLEEKLPQSQYAYRRNKSTENAICRIVDQIQYTEESIMINFDLIRAFGRVVGSRVGKKLLLWKVHPALANVVRLLIVRRKFKAEVRKGEFKCQSVPRTARRGVPQGSSLGPLLFIADANSLILKLEATNVQITTYADDIALIYNIVPGGKTRS